VMLLEEDANFLGIPNLTYEEESESLMGVAKQLALRKAKSLKASGLWENVPCWGNNRWAIHYSQNEELYSRAGIPTVDALVHMIRLWYEDELESKRCKIGALGECDWVLKLKDDFIAEENTKEILNKTALDRTDRLIRLLTSKAYAQEFAMNELTAIAEEQQSSLQELLMAIIRPIFVRYGIVCQTWRSTVNVDMAMTVEMLEEFLEFGLCGVMEEDLKYFCAIKLFAQGAPLAMLTQALYNQISLFQEYLEDHTAHIMIEGLSEKPKIGDVCKQELLNIMPLSVIVVPASTSVFNQSLAMSNLIRDYRRISKLYSPADLFYSPTGSDTYVGIMSVLNHLTRNGILNVGTQIIDAAAGRGDTAFACERLGFEDTVHFSLLDEYAADGYHKSVRHIENYDLSDEKKSGVLLDQLSLVYSSNALVILDVTFTSQLTQILELWIPRILKSEAKILIRLSDRVHSQWLAMELHSLNLSIVLLQPTLNSFYTPNTYILVAPPSALKAFNIVNEDHEWPRALALQMVSTLRVGKFVYESDESPYNSAIDKYTGLDGPLSNIFNAAMSATSYLGRNFYKTLSTRLLEFPYIPILPNQKLPKGVSVKVNRDVNRADDWKLKSTEKCQSKELREATVIYSLNYEHLTWIQMELLAIKFPSVDIAIMLRQLVTWHKSKRRSTVPMKQEEILQSLELELISRPAGPLSRKLVEAAVLFTVDTITGDPQNSTRILNFVSMNGVIRVKRLRESMHYRKLLEPLRPAYAGYLSVGDREKTAYSQCESYLHTNVLCDRITLRVNHLDRAVELDELEKRLHEQCAAWLGHWNTDGVEDLPTIVPYSRQAPDQNFGDRLLGVIPNFNLNPDEGGALAETIYRQYLADFDLNENNLTNDMKAYHRAQSMELHYMREDDAFITDEGWGPEYE
jgi:hypothetical protein